MLWPGSPASTGRKRLRNVVNRVRAATGDLVRRNGDLLELAPSARVDAELFESSAAQAFAAVPLEQANLARTTLARYAGDLLPDDRYEDWSVPHRERLRRRRLELLDLLAADAVEQGKLDDAIRLLEEAITAEPLDEQRYLLAAELLLQQGRRGGARALVARAAAVRSELGLSDTARLLRLRQATGLSPLAAGG